MSHQDAHDLLARLAPFLEPGTRGAFDIAASPEEGVNAVFTASVALSLKRIADALQSIDKSLILRVPR